ncbi:Hypothetical Protein XCAW_04728 [Xanthomonas citri subsp. citri Aw12879]|nr:Hypothetical Protein XCAW_04728 [Xanthomonas citri subsp. citri Aw12879]
MEGACVPLQHAANDARTDARGTINTTAPASSCVWQCLESAGTLACLHGAGRHHLTASGARPANCPPQQSNTFFLHTYGRSAGLDRSKLGSPCVLCWQRLSVRRCLLHTASQQSRRTQAVFKHPDAHRINRLRCSPYFQLTALTDGTGCSQGAGR